MKVLSILIFCLLTTFSSYAQTSDELLDKVPSLFSLAILGAFFGIVAVEGVLVNKIPMFVMLFIYSIAVYHFGFSKDYKAFFDYQNREN